MTKNSSCFKWNIALIVAILFALASVGFLATEIVASRPVPPEPTEPPTEPASYTIMDNFDTMVNEHIAAAHDATYEVDRVFWIPESAESAPKPNTSCYGEATDPKSLQWLLDEAAEILDGQELLFSTETEIFPGSKITYYLDESIVVITWQEVLDNYLYTLSEVKITHPSQFRRYLGGNEYNSDYMHPASRMSNMANAVMASSADYYRARNHGIIVYDGEVKRTDYAELVDACFIDGNGDMILVPAGEINGNEEAQAFVDAHNIDFSLAFGPILVNDGVRCEPEYYYLLGEINDEYPRAALCQKDKLHYVVITANGQFCYWDSITLHEFAKCIDELNFQKAYTLDGGRTGTIVMNGKALNPVESERWISDIIYFATAIPSPEEAPAPTEP